MLPFQNKKKQNNTVYTSISFQLVSIRYAVWLAICADKATLDKHTHTCRKYNILRPTVTDLCTEADTACKHSFPLTDDRANLPIRWLMVITLAQGSEKRTHTSVGSLSLLKSNYSIHMEVIVSHEYEMFGSPSFNIVRAVWMLLEEDKALKVLAISICVKGNWGGLEIALCLQ